MHGGGCLQDTNNIIMSHLIINGILCVYHIQNIELNLTLRIKVSPEFHSRAIFLLRSKPFKKLFFILLITLKEKKYVSRAALSTLP